MKTAGEYGGREKTMRGEKKREESASGQRGTRNIHKTEDRSLNSKDQKVSERVSEEETFVYFRRIHIMLWKSV
jgi:hypothetical protein